MRPRSFFAALLSITAACACAGFLQHWNHRLKASENDGTSFREAVSGKAGKQNKDTDLNEGVRLNFYDTPWERVLRSIAKQQQLTLVMDEVPPGRFAFRDREKYDLQAALRILNAELEPQGYRLLHQKNFLIVLNLDQARTEYARPRVERAGLLEEEEAEHGPKYDESDDSNRVDPDDVAEESEPEPVDDESAELDRASEKSPNSAATRRKQLPDARRPSRSKKITSVSHSSEGDDAADDTPAENGERLLLKTEVVILEHSKAADLARTIYLVFEKRAELQREGLNGLPSIVISESPAEGQPKSTRNVLFRIGIDQQQNQLTIEAVPARLPHLVSLVEDLDRPEQSSESVRVVPNNGLGAETAKDLNERIHQLVAMRSAAPSQSEEAASDGDRPAPSDDSNDSPESGDTEKPKPGGDSLNLRGEVNVQAMQDLGILILKGNESDVEKVAEIVARLEKMSVGSLPDIHVLTLQNVNSESLAELLTSVYDRLSELRQRGTTTRKTASFVPVVQPNAVLILAPQVEMDSILELATELDKPLEANFEFKVFALKSAIASQVVAALETFYSERGGLGTRLRVIKDVRTNSVIVQGRARDLGEVSELIDRIDKDESGAVNKVQIFTLKNAVATELSETINAAIQAVTSPPQQSGGQLGGIGGTQGAQELRDNKSVALEFLVADGATRQLVRSGILADVRVNPDSRSNSLIVSAPEASMNLLSALIEALDQAPSAVADIKVFTLKNADAEQSVTLLETMFENQNQEEQLGIQIAGTDGAASGLIPLRFSADIRTNTVLAIGGAEALSVVEAILARLDSSDARKRITEVIQLRNAPSDLVALSLNQFLEQQASLQDSSEDLISNIERLRQEVIVAENTNSNSLIISASPQYFSQIRTIVESLDATPPEVVIQALIVEVTLDATDEFGIELGFQDPLLLNRSLAATTTGGVTTLATTGTPGLNFNNTASPLGNNVGPGSSPGTVAAQGINNFSLGRQNADLGFGGFVFSAQSDAVSVLLRALAARRTVHVLSRPQIRTTHNNLALVNVGQDVPLVTGVTTNQLGGGNPTIERRNTGITLEVTPRIKPDGVVAMIVNASKSALSGNGVPIFINNDGSTIESPIINQSIAETTVNVPNGQTIVIGGMITKSDSTLERKVPWLGDLPIVGGAFRYDGTTSSRTELLIFLTPRIILSEMDSELIKQVESERIHFLESEAEEVHGPLFSVPPSDEGMECFPEPTEQQMVLPPEIPQQASRHRRAADNSDESPDADAGEDSDIQAVHSDATSSRESVIRKVVHREEVPSRGPGVTEKNSRRRGESRRSEKSTSGVKQK